ncbi:hypothetical protein [Noviherbaspirillum aridicola]|uniref:hypothetical protein n=1 Tax=Noviherbaspirillum aridicola TaxID=2849687 RepID=UPI001C8267EC|nr:hypothetical protein [Noviherbaspirillum aridicola]
MQGKLTSGMPRQPDWGIQHVKVKRKEGMGLPDLTSVAGASVAYAALVGSLELTDAALQQMCRNVEILEDLKGGDDGKALKSAKKAIAEAHKDLMAPSHPDKVWILRALKDYIRIQHPERMGGTYAPSAATRLAASPAPAVSPERDRLLQEFMEALRTVERTDAPPLPQAADTVGDAGESGSMPETQSAAERPDYRRQYVAEPAPSAPIDLRAYGRIPNQGGGDCLFHALSGRNLSADEIVALRGRVAAVRAGLSDTEQAFNAHRLVAGLTQTPGLHAKGMALMQGRHAIPNSVLAKFQAVPGMYAGEDELAQWSMLDENREKRVLVVHGNGPCEMYRSGVRQPVPREDFERHAQTADLILQRSGAHWEQIAPKRIAASSRLLPASRGTDFQLRHARHGTLEIVRREDAGQPHSVGFELR